MYEGDEYAAWYTELIKMIATETIHNMPISKLELVVKLRMAEERQRDDFDDDPMAQDYLRRRLLDEARHHVVHQMHRETQL